MRIIIITIRTTASKIVSTTGNILSRNSSEVDRLSPFPKLLALCQDFRIIIIVNSVIAFDYKWYSIIRRMEHKMHWVDRLVFQFQKDRKWFRVPSFRSQ